MYNIFCVYISTGVSTLFKCEITDDYMYMTIVEFFSIKKVNIIVISKQASFLSSINTLFFQICESYFSVLKVLLSTLSTSKYSAGMKYKYKYHLYSVQWYLRISTPKAVLIVLTCKYKYQNKFPTMFQGLDTL